MPKEYLGDGCYVDIERGIVKLTTSNGLRDTNTVFMEPEVLKFFERWVKEMRSRGALR